MEKLLEYTYCNGNASNEVTVSVDTEIGVAWLVGFQRLGLEGCAMLREFSGRVVGYVSKSNRGSWCAICPMQQHATSLPLQCRGS